MSSFAMVDGQQVDAKDITPATKGNMNYICSVCNEQVVFVREHKALVGFGSNRRHVIVSAHFNHKPGSTCVVARAESEQHLLMKAAWMDVYPVVTTEKHIPSGKRPDLVLTARNGHAFSVECQHSPISPDDVHSRFKDHNSDGLPLNFNFSSARLKNLNIDLYDGVFHALNAGAFRSVEFDSHINPALTWAFFDMHFLEAPQLVKAARPLSEINLVQIANRGYSVITPENDLDLLKFTAKGKTESLRGEHSRFLDYLERASNGNFEDPARIMAEWAIDVKNSESFPISVDVPKSKWRLYCDRETKRVAKEKADKAEQQREATRREHEVWQQSIALSKQRENEAKMRRFNEEVAKSRRLMQEQNAKEEQELVTSRWIESVAADRINQAHAQREQEAERLAMLTYAPPDLSDTRNHVELLTYYRQLLSEAQAINEAASAAYFARLVMYYETKI